MMMEEAAAGDDVTRMEKSLLEYVRKSTPPPFLMKTYMLVEDPATNDVVSWNSDGSAFVVWQPAEFSRDLLPTLFKHSNFSSFVRQLNTYGFRKVATTRWEFCNDMFRKGKRELLCEIRRRKAWTNKLQPKVAQNQTVLANDNESLEEEEEQRSSSTSSSCGYSSLVDENKRLKKENGVLSSELMSMKMKCKELFDLVAKYHNNRPEKELDDDDEDINDGDIEGPKLFGVRLEVQGELKRKRAREIGEGGSKILLSQSCK